MQDLLNRSLDAERTEKVYWAMNCVLAGAIALQNLQDHKYKEVKEQLTALTSDFTEKEVDYLIFRLKELLGEVE